MQPLVIGPMRYTRSLAFAVAASAAVVAAEHAVLAAQQLTTATIAGHVRDEQSEDIDGAVVRVVHGATGYAVQTATRAGRFVVAGLAVGGPYTVAVERVGYRSMRWDNIFLALGEQLQLELILPLFATTLDTLRIAAEPPGRSFARHGIGTAISDSALHRLPTIDRDLYDFVRLTP